MKQDVISKRGLFALLLAVFVTWGSIAAHAQFNLSVPGKTAVKPDEAFTIALTLTNINAQSISAFGAKLTFPNALLEYDTVSTVATLTNGWFAASGNEASPGEIILGGFNSTPITASGVLINLKFKAKSNVAGKDSLRLTNFTDDLATATAVNGAIEVAAPGTTLFAVLSGLNEVPPDTNTASGGGMFVLNAEQDELKFNLRVRGLSGPIAAAHFHNAATGSNGPVVRTLTLDFQGEVASGDWKSTDSEALTPALVAELLAGKIYVNVHTAANPAGELRGQVLVGKQMTFAATLNGAQEVQAVNTTANGAAVMKLDSIGTNLSFDIAVNGLSGPLTAAHFHNASVGVNGGVVRELISDFAGTTATGTWKDSDTQALTPGLVAELLAGRLYLNVHTSANPGGEIRGQVFAADSVIFLAALNGKEEVPSVNTNASGGGRFVLNAERTALQFRVQVGNLGGAITGSHFHKAATGVNGPVMRAITEFVDTTAVGIWKNTDAQALSLALVSDLLAGKIYVNIHTAVNPGGQIRGQVRTGQTISFGAQINGGQEVPPVNTAAAGFGKFTLTAAGTELSYSIGLSGLSGPITAAHFHNAAIGRNGPVKRTLTNDFTGNNASGIWKSSDAEALTSDLVVELLAGRIYVNVHTAANPSGEIRGQVIPGAKAVMPIALSRQVANGTVVTIEGIITRAVGRFTRMQDATAGMTIFETSGTFRTAVDSGRVRQGDLLRITGTMAEFSALKEITPIQSFEVISRDNALPAAQVVTLSEIKANGEKYESELLRVTSLIITGSTDTAFVAARTYNVYDPSDTSRAVALRTPSASDTRIAGLKIPKKFIFEGVLGQFSNADPAIGYQLQPVNRTDIAIDTKVDEGEAELPETFVLQQNYPNPFNPTTNLRYALPQNVRVKLVIYNLLGEKVRTLVDANERAGAKQITWDGLNDLGVLAASGVYVYRLEAGTFTATRKLMLMK